MGAGDTRYLSGICGLCTTRCHHVSQLNTLLCHLIQWASKLSLVDQLFVPLLFIISCCQVDVQHMTLCLHFLVRDVEPFASALPRAPTASSTTTAAAAAAAVVAAPGCTQVNLLEYDQWYECISTCTKACMQHRVQKLLKQGITQGARQQHGNCFVEWQASSPEDLRYNL